MKNQIASMLAVILIIGVAACTTPAGRSAGDVIDDSTVTTKVKAAFFDDKRLSGFAISVETFEGEVTLTGAVDNVEQKIRATEVAGVIRGVKRVNNLLKVK